MLNLRVAFLEKKGFFICNLNTCTLLKIKQEQQEVEFVCNSTTQIDPV